MGDRTYRSIPSILLLAGILTCSWPPGAAWAAEPLQVRIDEQAVSIRGPQRPIAEYRYAAVPFKPYLQRFLTPAGVNVLRDAPSDHLHHHGLMFALAVEGVSFWQEAGVAGRQVQRSIEDVRVTDEGGMKSASFTTKVDWLAGDSDDILLEERRTLGVFALGEDAPSLLTWRSELRAGPRGSVTLGGSHYYGLGMRFVQAMDANGTFHNAAGEAGEIVRGDERLARATSCWYTSTVDGMPVTVAMFDHPENVRHPAYWFTMGTPFAYMSATLNLYREPLVLAAEQPVVLQYGVALWRVDGFLNRIGVG